MNSAQSNQSKRSPLSPQNRFRPRGAIWWLSMALLGMAALFLAGCSDEEEDSGSSSSSNWANGPAYTDLFGTVTEDSSGCLVFPSGTGMISFDAGIATTTATITVSGSFEASDSFMMIWAYGVSDTDPTGAYMTSFAMDGGGGVNALYLFPATGPPPVSAALQSSGFAAYSAGDSFASWVTDFDPTSTSADSWWLDTTPAGSGDVTSTAMGTPSGTSSIISGQDATLCSYELT